MSIKPGQYVDFNDGYGFQKVSAVGTHWLRLETGGEYPIDYVFEVHDADEVDFGPEAMNDDHTT